jgi:uncharacterized protein (TIGR01777 family)
LGNIFRKLNKVVIAGGSGFLGQVLSKDLVGKGFQVIVLTRGLNAFKDGIEFIHWNGKKLGVWRDYLEGASALINLTGKTVQVKHNEPNKREILESRVNSVRVLKEAIEGCVNPPKVFVQASGISIYKSVETPSDESSLWGDDFLAEVSKSWEGEIEKGGAPNVRIVVFRFGIALGVEGGAFPILKNLTKYFLGSAIGSGDQGMSWFHVDDFKRLVNDVISDSSYSGVYNCCSPHPVSNSDFMRSMRKAMKRPWVPKVPRFIVMGVSGLGLGANPSIALDGVYCLPKRLQENGFKFQFEKLDDAIEDLLKKQKDS